MWRAMNRPGLPILAITLAILVARSYAYGATEFVTSLAIAVAIFAAVVALRSRRERRQSPCTGPHLS
jgi:ribosomal protein S26